MSLRWGIVTAGKISNDFVNSLNSYPNKGSQEVVAVAARNPNNAKEFAKLHNIKLVFESYQAMAISNDIDIAYIGALNPDHYELSKLFLENGKHVLCEKPLCLNAKQVKSLTGISKRNKKFLMEAVWSRFAPSYNALENEINAGKLGEVKFVEVNFGLDLAGIDIIGKKELGGSAILYLGIYTLQFAQYVFKDEPIKVTATGDLNSQGVDEVVTIILEYTGGRRAVLNVNSKLKLWNKATVYGTKGRTTLPEPFHFPTEIIHYDGQTENFPLHTSKIPYNFGNSAGLVYEAIEAEKCIQQGLLESPRMSHQESLLIAKLSDSIRKQIGVQFDVDDKEYN